MAMHGVWLTGCGNGETHGEKMQILNTQQIENVNGAGTLADISYAMAGAAAVAGGLAMVPTPASPALGGFAVLTGLMSAGFGWMSCW